MVVLRRVMNLNEQPDGKPMIMETSPFALEIVVTDAATKDSEIDSAVLTAREVASKERLGGILVTRKGPATFLVAISDEIPYGTTQEQELW